MTWKYGWLGAAGSLTLAFLLNGPGVENGSAPAGDHRAEAPAVIDADLCEGAVEGDINLEIVPVSVRSDGKDERLNLAVETTLDTEAAQTMKRTLRVIDPFGEEIIEEKLVGEGVVRPGYTTADEIELAGLRDGYYRVVARAMAGEAWTDSEIYVLVKDGAQQPIPFADWYERSGVADVGGPDEPAAREVR